MLGDVVRTQTFELSSAQTTELLNRNPALGELISNAIVYGTVDLSQGYSFTDAVYGNVLISVDARGHLRVLGQSPVDPGVINAPPPSGIPQLWPNPLDELIKILVVIGVGAILAAKYL